MSVEHDAFQNLAERIEDAFADIDSDVCVYLRETDAEYAEMYQECIRQQEIFPLIPVILEGGDSEIRPSAKEQHALVRYLMLKHEMENIERQHIYFRGHTDCFAYLKKIGAI